MSTLRLASYSIQGVDDRGIAACFFSPSAELPLCGLCRQNGIGTVISAGRR